MYDETELMKTYIRTAIRHYEDRFTGKRIMSAHRAIDVSDLKIILDKPYTRLGDCVHAIRQRLLKIKTGWWIFQTGRSQLKGGITPILHIFESPVTQNLIDQLAKKSQDLSDAAEQLNELRAKNKAAPAVTAFSVISVVPHSEPLSINNSERPAAAPRLAFSVEERSGPGFFGRKV